MGPWHSMFDRECQQRVLGRVHRLSPESEPRWGRMDAPRMISHLIAQLEHALGRSRAAPVRGPLRFPGVKLASIYVLPWPKGTIEGPREAFERPPGEFDEDVAELEDLLDRFYARGPVGDWPEHALFGRMSGRDWGVFCHKHFDHHLRQFGV